MTMDRRAAQWTPSPLRKSNGRMNQKATGEKRGSGGTDPRQRNQDVRCGAVAASIPRGEPSLQKENDLHSDWKNGRTLLCAFLECQADSGRKPDLPRELLGRVLFIDSRGIVG